jgi:lipoprotein-releasing system ATP-binding protein
VRRSRHSGFINSPDQGVAKGIGHRRAEPGLTARTGEAHRGRLLTQVTLHATLPSEARLDPDPEVAIRTIDLTKLYQSGENRLVVFERVNLEVRRGERVALIGESGAGKSTLLHLLGGLDKPTSGTIHFGAQEVTSLGHRELAEFRNRAIGFVWQTHYLLPEFTALENVMMPLLIRGVPPEQCMAPARERLGEVGLAERTHHRSGELSGGEQQRVVIARALVTNPEVLLADEPTGNLDHATGERVADLFDELHRIHRFTSVVVTHNIGFARRCDRILRLERGLLVPANGEIATTVPLQGPHTSINTDSRTDGTNHV